MATPLNVELAEGLGFAVPDGAGPNDLLITLRGVDDAALAAGLSAVEGALIAPRQRVSGTGVARPRTVRSAAAIGARCGLVLLSVPGSSVIGEALDAIAAGRHVMIFSDNVPVDQEVALKTAAEATCWSWGPTAAPRSSAGSVSGSRTPCGTMTPVPTLGWWRRPEPARSS